MSKTLQEYLSLPYTIILRRDTKDEIVVARVEELPGCSAHGDTEQEAVLNLRDNMEAWIGDCIDSGDAVPEPAAEKELPSGKWLQRVPRSLHLKLIRLAKEEGVSLNQLVTSALAEAVGGKEVSAKRTPSAEIEVSGFNAVFLGGPCLGAVGSYNVKNEIGLPYYMPFESEWNLARMKSGTELSRLPKQERRLHAEEKKSSVTYQC